MMDGGSYQIFLLLDSHVSINVGALGKLNFIPGVYVYTGSAVKNLAKRIERHRNRNKKKRWHIDYLTSNRHFKIVKVVAFHSGEREECFRNKELQKLKSAHSPFKGFGSSDCRTCHSHLLYFPDMPTLP